MINKGRTEAGVWVFCLDPLAPVLAKEHICGEGTFRCFGVLFAFAARGGGFFGLFGGLALWTTVSDGVLSIRIDKGGIYDKGYKTKGC